MNVITQTNLWKRNFESSYADENTNEFVEFLKNSFIDFRSRVDEIANEIPNDIKGLTVHSMVHIDALWEIVDLIFPSELVENPLEAYVLGGAFLLHDLGHALATYPGGIDELKKTDAWTLASYSDQTNLEQNVLANALRLNHAKHATNLAVRPISETGTETNFLIQDQLLRQHLGNVMGRIAYSHWWPSESLINNSQLTKTGAIPGAKCPHTWTVDTMKLAFVLRVCDACQIDGRRAPVFVKSLRKPEGIAEQHWCAQENICKPFCENNELHFTSSRPFDAQKSEAWWTFFELANVAERELRFASDIFRNKYQPLMANRVAGASSPERFSEFVKVDGWMPIDTHIKVSSAESLVQKLGGATLYGMDVTVPLRELIQNSRDAIVCRRAVENRRNDWGTIGLELLKSEFGNKLIISDNGIGISERNIRSCFLDFGESYWTSGLLLEEHPRIANSEFVPTGKFGIGFFSVFMLGCNVKIVTRTISEGPSDTRVLHFNNGPKQRPTLRRGNTSEELIDPGTKITIELSDDVLAEILRVNPIDSVSHVERNAEYKKTWNFDELIEWLCPAIDVDLEVSSFTTKRIAVSCSDWKTLSAEKLLARVLLHRADVNEIFSSRLFQHVVDRLENIETDSGEVIGRACLVDNFSALSTDKKPIGIVTCGGFRSRSTNAKFPGLLIGDAKTATRFDATPKCFNDLGSIETWATKVASTLCESNLNLMTKTSIAANVRCLNGKLNHFKFLVHEGNLVSSNQIVESFRSRDKAILVPFNSLRHDLHTLDDYFGSGEFSQYDRSDPNQIGVLIGRFYEGWILGKRPDPDNRGEHRKWNQYWYALWGAAIEAVAAAWNSKIDLVLSNSRFDVAVENKSDEIDILVRPQK